MTTVPQLWPGQTVACLASGPSLTQSDVDYLRGKVPVIAVNDTVRLAPWADVLYSSDRVWWPRHRAVPSFQGLRYGIGSAPGKRNGFQHYPEITVLRNTGFDGIETSPDGLRNGKNSGYAAVNLAVHFGAARIVLLGYDMSAPAGKTHFFGEHQGMTNPTDSHFSAWRRLFASMAEPLAALGVEIINCSARTALDCFPCRPLRAVLVDAEVLA